jgi:UDP-N-acetylmuramoyl-L-alanyl-D-glutamate--2,6-diaminopimelate ligase
MRTLHSAQEAARWLHSRVTGELRTDSRLVQAGDGFIAWVGHDVLQRPLVDRKKRGGGVTAIQRDPPGQAAETRQARQAGVSSDALRGGKVVTAARRFKGG